MIIMGRSDTIRRPLRIYAFLEMLLCCTFFRLCKRICFGTECSSAVKVLKRNFSTKQQSLSFKHVRHPVCLHLSKFLQTCIEKVFAFVVSFYSRIRFSPSFLTFRSFPFQAKYMFIIINVVIIALHMCLL